MNQTQLEKDIIALWSPLKMGECWHTANGVEQFDLDEHLIKMMVYRSNHMSCGVRLEAYSPEMYQAACRKSCLRLEWSLKNSEGIIEKKISQLIACLRYIEKHLVEYDRLAHARYDEMIKMAMDANRNKRIVIGLLDKEERD